MKQLDLEHVEAQFRLMICEKEKITWKTSWSDDYGYGLF